MDLIKNGLSLKIKNHLVMEYLDILKINFVTCLVLKELEFTTLDTLVLQF